MDSFSIYSNKRIEVSIELYLKIYYALLSYPNDVMSSFAKSSNRSDLLLPLRLCDLFLRSSSSSSETNKEKCIYD